MAVSRREGREGQRGEAGLEVSSDAGGSCPPHSPASRSLASAADAAGGSSSAAAGSSAAGGSSSAAGAAAEPQGMRMFLSQIREWVVDFGADMLFISIRTDVAW